MYITPELFELHQDHTMSDAGPPSLSRRPSSPSTLGKRKREEPSAAFASQRIAAGIETVSVSPTPSPSGLTLPSRSTTNTNSPTLSYSVPTTGSSFGHSAVPFGASQSQRVPRHGAIATSPSHKVRRIALLPHARCAKSPGRTTATIATTLRNPALGGATSVQQQQQQQRPASRTWACHICHRKAVLKTDLDSFIDCENCGLCTCFICIRECVGDACGRRVCSGCCIEEGVDGVVWCIPSCCGMETA